MAPPTDPNVGYPASIYSDKPGNTSGTGTQTALVEGFLYPIDAATVATNRIELGVDENELYTAWCQLQTSYDWSDPANGISGYYCIPRFVTATRDPSPAARRTSPTERR